jgi:glycosyltransferase involved in cell wall biosynthesis
MNYYTRFVENFSSYNCSSKGVIMVKVILSTANVPIYRYTAQALEQARLLKRYICTIALREESSIPPLVPEFWRKKLEAKRIKGIPYRKVVGLWLPELLQHALPRTGLLSHERTNWFINYLYDWLATYYIDECDIFHFMSGVGLYCARKVKAHKHNVILICDVRQTHPDYQIKILEEENQILGIKAQIPGVLYVNRFKSEFLLSDFIIVPSLYARETFVREGIDPEKIFVVPYGFDPERFYAIPKEDKDDEVFRILFIGSINLIKGVYYLIEAFTQLRLPKSELVLIGQIDPSMQAIVKRSIEMNKCIRHIANVPNTELFQYYNKASVFVLPSIVDAYGLVVLEAMACGLPVIVTENVGIKELIQEGVNGFVIPIRDINTLKERLLFLYQNKAKRLQMGYEARQRVQEFTWDQYGKRLIRVYEEILKRVGFSKYE